MKGFIYTKKTLFLILVFGMFSINNLSAQCSSISQCFSTSGGGVVTYAFFPVNITTANTVIIPDEVPATDLKGASVKATDVGCFTVNGVVKHVDMVITVYDSTKTSTVGVFNTPSFVNPGNGIISFLGAAYRLYSFKTQFFLSGTTTPINVSILQQVTDIDGDGDWDGDGIIDDPRCNVPLVQHGDDYAWAKGFNTFGTIANTHIYTRVANGKTYFHSSAVNNTNYSGISGRAITPASQAFLLGFLNTSSTEFGYASGAFGGLFIDYTVQNLIVTLPCAYTLPLNWLSFTGAEKDGKINLNWRVANEENVLKYTVERSLDGSVFEEIGTVDYDNVNTDAEKNYYFSDRVNSINSKMLYYRIKQYDNDQSYSYSTVVTVNLNSKKGNYNIFPNPIDNRVYVNLLGTKNEMAEVCIYNSLGQIQRKESKEIVEGNNTITIENTEDIPSGIYTISIIMSDNTITEKIIKL